MGGSSPLFEKGGHNMTVFESLAPYQYLFIKKCELNSVISL